MQPVVAKRFVRYAHSLKWRVIGGSVFLLSIVLAACIAVIVPFSTAYFSSSDKPSTFLFGSVEALAKYVGAVILGYGVFLGTKYYNFGRRWVATDATDLLKSDLRSPVVYLRSLHDDDFFGSKVDGLLATNEEVLVEALNKLGPVIAVGKPGESLPTLGAAKLYLANPEWQTNVTELCQSAALVVFKTGTSPGLLWELEHLFGVLDANKFVILVGDDNEAYGRFCDEFFQRTSIILPKLGVNKDNSEGYRQAMKRDFNMVDRAFRAIIFFDQLKNPHNRFLTTNTVPFFRRTYRHKVHPYLHTALKPVYEQLARQWQPPPISPLRVLSVVAGIIVVIFSILSYHVI